MRSTRRWRHRRGVMLAVVAVIAAALGVAARQSGVTRGLEQSSIDARFQIRGRTPPPPGFVLVAIDATTFDYFRDAGMRSQFPFPRRYYARVIDNLHKAGARGELPLMDWKALPRVRELGRQAAHDALASDPDAAERLGLG